MGASTLIDLKTRRSGRTGKGGDGDGEEPGLYAKRRQIYPQLVHGRFRLIKWLVLFSTLGVYYLLPWFRWDRGEGAPSQAVLADFADGRFYFFGLEIWPQEVYYITGLLILAALGLFLVTALFGRVWCGYACPQTVWTDLFLVVERMFEGDRNARIQLDRAPWSFNKAWRKTAKHAGWLAISFLTGGVFILYWHDAPTLARTFFTGHAETTAYVFAGLLTFTTYALAGTMREQVCTYLCPWPRIQAAMIDKDTLAVTYRSDRGEPRGHMRKPETWQGRGDCIDCTQCVTACPMGIDIREGLQLECIHCALCIDACTVVMKKVGRPVGLITYDTDENVTRRAQGKVERSFRLLRPRIVLYAAVMAIVAGVMAVGLLTRSNFEVNVLKDRSLPFVRLSAGDIRNGYTLNVANKLHAERTLALCVEGPAGARVEVVGEQVASDGVILSLAPDAVERYRVLVTAPAGATHGASPIRFILKDLASGDRKSVADQFASPEANR